MSLISAKIASTVDDLKAASITDNTVIYDQATFKWMTDDYSAAPSGQLDLNIVKSDSASLSEGAWIRQGADRLRSFYVNTFDDIRTASIPSAFDVIVTGSFGVSGVGGARYREIVDFGQTENAWTKRSGDGRLFQIAETTIRPVMLGAAADGVADDTTAIINAKEAAVATGAAIDLSGTYAVDNLVIDDSVTILSNKGVLKALPGSRANAANAMRSAMTTITAADVTIIGDLTFDANYEMTRGLYVASTASNFHVTGKILCGNLYEVGDDFNAGLLMDGVDGYDIDAIHTFNTVQTSGGTNLYGGIRMPNSGAGRIGSIYIENANQALNPGGSDGLVVENITVRGASDNGIYLDGGIQNSVFGNIDLDGVEEGCVLGTHKNANIRIGSFICRNATNKGITLRTGSGYWFGQVKLLDATIQQSADYDGVTGLRIESCDIVISDGSSLPRPIDLTDNPNISFGTLRMSQKAPKNGRFISLSGNVNGFHIGILEVVGDPDNPSANAIYGTDIDGTPSIKVGVMLRRDVSSPIAIASANAENVRVFDHDTINNGSMGLTIQSNVVGGALLKLRSAFNGEGAESIVGGIEVTTGDTSTTRPLAFQMLTKSVTSNGSAHETDLLDDSSNIVLRVLSAGKGIAIKLPTSASEVHSGEIYNNGGVVAIKP